MASYLVGTAVTALRPTAESDAIFEVPAWEATHRPIAGMAYIGSDVIVSTVLMKLRDHFQKNGRTNPKMVVCMWSFAAMVFTCSGIINYCIYGIVKALRTSMNIARKKHTYHKKLFWLLLSQVSGET